MPDRPAPLVLYVEDDRIHLILMEEVIRLLPGWELRCAETGAEALELMACCRPDVLLVDMHLPDMTGLDLRNRFAADETLAARLDHARWVAISADNPGELVRAARAAGFDDYWLKPIELAQMQARLQALLPARAEEFVQ